MSKSDIPGSRRSMHGFEGRTFELWVILDRWPLISASAVPRWGERRKKRRFPKNTRITDAQKHSNFWLNYLVQVHETEKKVPKHRRD